MFIMYLLNLAHLFTENKLLITCSEVVFSIQRSMHRSMNHSFHFPLGKQRHREITYSSSDPQETGRKNQSKHTNLVSPAPIYLY